MHVFYYQYECFLLSFKLSKLKKYIDLTEFVLNLSCSTDLVFFDTLNFIFTIWTIYIQEDKVL